MIRGKIPPLKSKPFNFPTIRVVNPGKGLNTLVSAELIDDHEASDLNNVVFTEAGTITKGPGTSAWGTGLVGNPRGLGTFLPQGGTAKVVTVDNGILKTTTAATDAWTAAAGASLTSGVPITFTSARTNPNASTGADVLYAWDGTLGGVYFDGTTVTRPGTMPSASFSIFFNGLHIAAGTSTNKSRIYIADDNTTTVSWSTFVNSGFSAGATATLPPHPSNPVDVPGTTAAGAASTNPNIIDVNPGDGDSITGLAKFQNTVIVFKNRAIYQVTFASDGTPTVTLINTYLGAVSHRSIDNVENDVFYLTRLGWFTLGYQSGFYTIIRSNELSVRIHPLVTTINPSKLTQVSAIYKPYQFLSSIPSGGSTYNNITVVYDKRYDAWSKLDYIHAESFTVFTDSTNTEQLLYTDANTNKIWKIDDSLYTNNSAAIDSYWQSKAFDGGEPANYKFWIDLTLYVRQLSGTLTVTVYTDANTLVHTSTIGGNAYNGGIAATGAFGTELWGGNSNVNTNGDPYPSNSSGVTVVSNVPYRIPINTQSRTLMIKVEEATVNSFGLLGFELAYRPLSRFVFPSQYKVN